MMSPSFSAVRPTLAPVMQRHIGSFLRTGGSLGRRAMTTSPTHTNGNLYAMPCARAVVLHARRPHSSRVSLDALFNFAVHELGISNTWALRLDDRLLCNLAC